MATVTVKHGIVTGASADPTALVDGPAWDAVHTVTGLENVQNVDTTNAANITSGTLPATVLPMPTASTLGGVKSLAAVSHKFLTQIGTDGSVSQAQPAFSDISGSLPNPSASTLGGVESIAAVSHNWINSISTSGVPAQSQPATADLSDIGTFSLNTSGTIATSNVTDATSTSTGAITTAGGISSQKRMVPNNLTVATAGNNSIGTATTFAQIGLYHAGTITASGGFGRGWQIDAALTAAANNDLLASAYFGVAPNKGAFTGVVSYMIFGAVGYDYIINTVSAGVIKLADVTASTTPTTGSIITGGGIGLAGALYAGAEIKSASASGGIGYATGAGGVVTQATSRTTGVTLSKVTGAITLFAAAPAVGTWVSCTVTNTTVAATDTVSVSVKSGTNTYIVHVTSVSAGSFQISFTSIVGTASDSPVINFNVIKGSAS